MIKLLKNANVYAPAPLGMRDILIAGEKIFLMDRSIRGYEGLDGVEVLDLEGRTLAPGYIDLHVHITGGGGEQGPASRVPESQLSVFLKNGITTVVGLLGTDGVTRSVENLLAKARALTEEGITAYALTSFYGYPPATITGDVERDIMLMDPVIGVKVAISDHRGSNPTGEELIRLASSARRGGLLSGKPGLVTMHVGPNKSGLETVFYALEHSDVPVRNFLPTHIHRSRDLIDQGAELVRRGGFVDFTANSSPGELEDRVDKLLYCLEKEGMPGHLSMSSDGYGSTPRFNAQGECVGLTYASPKSLHITLQALVKRGVPLETALSLLTSVPADILGKKGGKGCVAPGADADLLVLDRDLEIFGLFARGRTALWQGELKMRGKFEE